MTKQDDTTAVPASRDDVLAAIDLADALVRGFLAGLMRQQRSLATAVDYVLANRARTLLIEKYDEFFRAVDVVVGGGNLAATNLSGHPQVVVPTAVGEAGNAAISFIAALYREDLALRLAHAWQTASDIHLQRPPKFS